MKAKNPHAVEMGKLSGAVWTDAKRQASRENGKKGGRPRGPNYRPRKKASKAEK